LSAAVVLIAAKANAMAKNVAERERNPHDAAQIEIAGPIRRRKNDPATFNFGFDRCSISGATYSYLNPRKAGLSEIAVKDHVRG
jgi:hypothetical protein